MGNFFEQLIQDEENLAINLITLNLLPQQLSRHKLDLLETKLKLVLATKLWSPNPAFISPVSKSLYIQALRASCVNPFDFYGHDVVTDLARDFRKITLHSNGTTDSSDFDTHLIAFTICLVSENTTAFEGLIGQTGLKNLLKSQEVNSKSVHRNVHIISGSKTFSQDPDPNKGESPAEAGVKCSQSLEREKELNSLLMRSLAVSCYSKLPRIEKDNTAMREVNREKHSSETIKNDLNDLLAKILANQDPKSGSFGGNMITTALAVQAFIESGLDKLSFLWNRRKAIDFLNQNLNLVSNTPDDAYFIVPAFHRTWHEIDCRRRSKKVLKEVTP